jgi:hypothetical protein
MLLDAANASQRSRQRVLSKSGRVNGAPRGHPPFASDWCLFLDIDGTLLEHQHRPDDVVVDSGAALPLGRSRNGSTAPSR